ncbi:motility associated factor glycosyltransferase family protein [Paenibacillus sp. TH7-28]
MKLLKANEQILHNKYPELARVIDYNVPDRERYEVVYTKNNEFNLKRHEDGIEYFYHSKYNAEVEAVRWIQATMDGKSDNEGPLLLFGVGMGHFLKAVLEKTEVKQIIVYEPDINVFHSMLQYQDVSGLLDNDRVKMVAVGEHELILLELASYISEQLSGTITLIAAQIYRRLYKETFIQLEKVIIEAVRNSKSNFQTFQRYQMEWVQNILYNIPHCIVNPSIAALKGISNNGVIAVIGSGPSLQEDIHLLEQLKQKCILIAAGSSIQILQHHNIDPHLIVTMDGGIPNLNVFKNIDRGRTPLVFVNQSHYQIQDIYQSEMFHSTFEGDTISQYLLEGHKGPSFEPTASVTGTAMQLAAYMGAKDIILLGQDLSFPDQKYYSAGANHVTEQGLDNALRNATEYVENVSGGMNPTSAVMTITRKNIEFIISVLQLNGIRFINTSSKGAKIKGAEWESLEDIIKVLQANQVPALHSLNAISKTEENLSEKVSNKMNHILNEAKTLDKSLTKIKQELTSMAKNVKTKNANNLNKNLLKVNKLWQSITDQDIFKYFHSFGLAYHINHYMRFVPKIVDATNPFTKAALIIEHLGKLVDELISFNPKMTNYIQHSLHRMDQLHQQEEQL